MTMMLDLKDEKDEVGCRKVDCDGPVSRFNATFTLGPGDQDTAPLRCCCL